MLVFARVGCAWLWCMRGADQQYVRGGWFVSRCLGRVVCVLWWCMGGSQHMVDAREQVRRGVLGFGEGAVCVFWWCMGAADQQ